MVFVRFSEAKSSRGKSLLTHGGYEYVFEALSKMEEGFEYWRCPYRPPYCPGRARIRIGWQVDDDGDQYKEGDVTGHHNHPPVFGNQMLRESVERLRTEARSDFPTTSRNIVREVRSNLPIDVRVTCAPSAYNMQWTYNYQRRKQQEELGDVGLDVLPTSEIVVPIRLQNRVILDHLEQGQRTIVFCSQFGINTLANYRNDCAIDGTFETSPRGFAQLYTMSAIVDHCSIPCVYGLLPSKNVNTYRRFFEAIRNAVGHGWFPVRLMSDFEASALRAFEEIFPETIRSGCLFHLGQSLFRRIQRLPRLFTAYNEDETIKRSLRCLQALALVPVPFVYNYLCILMSTLEPTPELQELILYYVNTWIGPRHIALNEPVIEEANAGAAADGWIRNQIVALNLLQTRALFAIELWNMVERLEAGFGRTNNSVEAWHCVWNARLKGNQRLSPFVRKMVEEDELWAGKVDEFVAAPADGIRGPNLTRKAKYIRQDNNLLAILHNFENRDPLVYLRGAT